MPGVIFVNPHAGSADVALERLGRLFPDDVVEACDPGDLPARVRTAISSGGDVPDFIGVAGGDGTMGCVAAELVDGDIALLALPGGTRNHFAGDLGIDSFETAARARREGVTRRIDTGFVDGRVFVNNASIGIYPALVRRREHHQRRFRKSISHVIAMVEQIRHGRRFAAVVDDTAHPAWAVFIGNGRYGDALDDLTRREALDDGVLDVRVVRGVGRASRLRVLGALLTRRLSASPLVERLSAGSVSVDVLRPSVDVALDGEVVRLTSPLVVECRPRSLEVLVAEPVDDTPDDTPDVAPHEAPHEAADAPR